MGLNGIRGLGENLGIGVKKRVYFIPKTGIFSLDFALIKEKKAAFKEKRHFTFIFQLLVDRYRSASEASCLCTIRDPDIDLAASYIAARVRNQIGSAISSGTEIDVASQLQYSRIGCDDAAAYAVTHCRSAF